MRTLLLAVLLAASGSVFGQTPEECGTVPVIYVTQGFLDEIVANEDAFEASWSEVRPTLPPDQQAVGDCAIVEWRLLIAQAVVTGPQLSPRRIDVLAIIGDDRSGFVAAKVVDTSYEVGIDTEILSPDGKVYERWGGFHFASVGAPMREWLLGSCKAALFQIIDAVGEETPGWTIRYRTAILPGYDPGWADFTGLSFSRITEFRRFALDELRIMANYREWEEDATPAPPTKPTSTLRFILGLIWSAAKRDLSRANARLF